MEMMCLTALFFVRCIVVASSSLGLSPLDLPQRSESIHDASAATKCHSLLQRSFSVPGITTPNEGTTNQTDREKQVSAFVATQNEFVRASKVPVSVYVLLVAFIMCMLLIWYCASQESTGPDKVQHKLFSLDRGKVYVYSNEQLLTWRILFNRAPSIVLSWRVWIVMPCVLGMAFGCALMIELGVPYANMLDTTRIDEFAKYLRVFIAFMLGLFMNNSFGRWQSAVSTFRQILTSIKQLMWTARMMHLREDLAKELERKCLVACYIIDAEMRTDLSCKASDCQEHWDRTFKLLKEAGFLTDEEDKDLRTDRKGLLDFDMGGYSTKIWSWIGNVISRVRQEPGVLVPMYVRLVSVSHSCLGQVDQLRTCVQVQVPFTYSYLLSMLVHLNNVMLALCSGLKLGASMAELRESDKLGKSTSPEVLHALFNSAEIAGTGTLILLIQPVMYQACLVIANMLNHPFGDDISHLPTETFILMLRDELAVLADSFETDEASKSLPAKPKDDDSSGGSDSGGDDDDDDDDDDGGD